MSKNNGETKLIVTWPSNCVITDSTGAAINSVKNTKLYVKVVAFSTKDNTKLSQQLKSGFKQIFNWNKH